MTYEKSCGAIVFTRIGGETKYVLAQSKNGYFGFPKGHVEGNETEVETALREVYEEVHLQPLLIDGFRTVIEYYIPSVDVQKQVVFFLGEYYNQQITIQEEELQAAPLVSYEEAMQLLEHDSNKSILNEANRFLTRYFQAKDSQSLYELAMKHIYGDGVPEDNELAVKLLTQAHELGHVEATYNLGICYHYGYGIAVDLAKAYDLYLESANGGYGKGMELVGRFYNRGIYVEQDRKQAEYWLQKAVESSDPDAVAEAKKELNVGE